MPRGRRKGAIPGLAQREQQVLECIYRQGEASAAEVAAALDDELTLAGVHTILRSIESKGYIAHRAERGRHIFYPKTDHETAASSAFSRLVDTFFAGSVYDAMATLLDRNSRSISEEELAELKHKIDAYTGDSDDS